MRKHIRHWHGLPGRRPLLDKHAAIAEQIAMLEPDEPVDFPSEVEVDDADYEWVNFLDQSLDQDEDDEPDEYDEEPVDDDWLTEPYVPWLDSQPQVSEVAYGIEPDEPWPPVVTYGEALAELGEFVVTGPSRPEPPSQQYVRVYELARVCDLPPKVVIGLLRFRDEYVTSHLSKLAKPAARQFLADLANIHGDLDALIENTRPKFFQEQFTGLYNDSLDPISPTFRLSAWTQV